ncbi:Ribosomal RNA large subunit methyltransferase J (rRNA (uridine-2'-O-)-methyltransferase) (23S rRNA methyltransferase) [Herminiimonas arsenicoxydans]|uniref:Ribosomal RNA large subunit methyltransferase E n=1 Tax=Herminiimonas arsenicoxydans TaxID=204773 RepID=RLME_HERAR|nr:RecName: Full=Ribosomal RNA large subunit methyltransferase E; AltName: Full=23S rRNA Um2552 methyltransferase; AltName: Full=rRNA (uridine-2'-O-)-methyltransferase [Herminiimonas arsenicoxydans]CAL61347.1 Ribosomal RNA large subunit methyltransferase J (rRNA (uridine-2'-O-)-methyltransferase) (23S rRNA methyltransferase) [Herminiimonas arsenicoxydans]
MAKKKLNKNWLHDHINDPYVKLAQKEGYRARAVYKLKEIDESEKLIKPGQIIVDLGCTPGSWSQYVRNKLSGSVGGGINGIIIGLDMLEMEPIADVHYIQGDFREQNVLEQLEVVLAGRKVDLVLSDMAPNLSGIAVADAARMMDIIELAIDFAQHHMKPSGSLLVKCFNGSGFNDIVEKFRHEFKTVTQKKPKASRDKSSEIFLLGKTLKNPL